jgi:hypothetical protein
MLHLFTSLFGLPGLVIFVVLVFLAIVNAVNRFQRRDYIQLRSSDYQALAAKLGFDSYIPNQNADFAKGWCFLSRLSQGENRYAFNLLQGTYQQQTLFVFDYHYQTNDGQEVQHRFFTIFMLIIKETFPKICIGTERSDALFSRMAESVGGEDIKFESAEFSRIFRVRSRDKKFAYDVCNPQMMEYLLANPDLEIEIQGPVISLAFEPQLSASDIEPNLQRLAQIRALLPQYLFIAT